MSDRTSTDQYGRKQWDVEAYAEEAKKATPQTRGQPIDEALARKLKLQTFLQHRAELLDQSLGAVGKHTLIGAESGATSLTYGKNKRFGFTCPTCDLSFRDTLALVDHFNSPQHVKNLRQLLGDSAGTGEELEDGVKRASQAQVIATLEDLVKKLLRAKAAAGSTTGLALGLQERVQRRLEFEQRKTKRKQERRKKKRIHGLGVDADTDPETEIGKLMGFEGFGSTKV